MGTYHAVKQRIRHSALVHPGEGWKRAVAALVEYRRHCDEALRQDSAAAQRTRVALGETGCMIMLEAINIQIDPDRNAQPTINMGHGEHQLWWELLKDISAAALSELDENYAAYAYHIRNAWQTYSLIVEFFLWDRDSVIEEGVARLNDQVEQQRKVQP